MVIPVFRRPRKVIVVFWKFTYILWLVDIVDQELLARSNNKKIVTIIASKEVITKVYRKNWVLLATVPIFDGFI